MDTHDRKSDSTAALVRRVQNAFPSLEEVAKRLNGEKNLSIYFGIDPTGPEVHIGHTVPLLLLRDLAKAGHTITLLIGDFTARIGDPTGKSTTRTALTEEEVVANMASYLEQITAILPKDSFSVAYNSEWLSGLSFEQLVKLMSKVTVQQMIQRDMFQERIQNDQPIYLNEFMYPLMQGYDSVALRADGEVGGNDQTFNMLMGRDLEKALIQKDKFVLATHLLIDGATGKKMSKSEGTLIALRDSPQEIRRKVLAMDDGMIATVFTLCTDKSIEWIEENSKGDPRAFKEELSAELIRMYHGEEKVGAAQEATSVSGGALDQIMVSAGAATSLSGAHNLINEGAVRVNDEVVKEWKYEAASGDRIRIGKGKFLEIT